MVTDIQNHSQPNLIRRAAYERTGGWEGFEDFLFAGEDCDLYLKLEEVASVELLDDVLYYYRLHGKRTSHRLTADGAFEMWRRLADKTIGRRGLPLERVTDRPPFRYRRLETARPEPADVDWIVVESEPSGGDLKAVTTAALRACGAREDAIHVVKPGLSLAAARNEGFRGTCRRIVFFIDSGVAPESPDVIDQILEAMHESDADLAAPLLLAPDGHVYGPGGFDENLRPILYRGGASDSARSRRVPGAAWLPAEALAVRREVIRSVGGFDEQQLSGVFAEADFCLKARSRGFRCTSAGTMSATTNPAEPDGSRGLDVFARKWGAQTTLFEDEVPKIV